MQMKNLDEINLKEFIRIQKDMGADVYIFEFVLLLIEDSDGLTLGDMPEAIHFCMEKLNDIISKLGKDISNYSTFQEVDRILRGEYKDKEDGDKE